MSSTNKILTDKDSFPVFTREELGWDAGGVDQKSSYSSSSASVPPHIIEQRKDVGPKQI